MNKLFRNISIILLLALAPTMFSCSGLREHIKQRQLETHGPKKGVHNNNVAKESNKPKENKTSNTANASIYKKYSEKWKVDLSGKENANFLADIDSWLGVPYVYGGNSKKGTDCSGFIQTLYKENYGISLNRSANDMQKDVEFIDISKGKLGDILFFKINGSRVSHVGLYLGNRRFIHATTSKGVMINSIDDAYYTTRYYKCGRITVMEGKY